ncbi:hypothetical protein Mal4_54360 [Maioricimonas rarisocia]|uniref:Uncharacterized protein n=1 Tax=Maioricimonas rarisocia TaxID=2528026 RepID=A0A517ZF24_9PLAN|nr:hypothetical protein [Maioricimonas rarisocia]QDU41071.1 hypothetical protein Mal4_54360 [Maioricimonas rarisocia]
MISKKPLETLKDGERAREQAAHDNRGGTGRLIRSGWPLEFLQQAFHAPNDRIIVEVHDPTLRREASLQALLSRTALAEESDAEIQPVRFTARGINTARGYVEARHRLGTGGWIAIIGDSDIGTLARSVRSLIPEAPERMVVVSECIHSDGGSCPADHFRPELHVAGWTVRDFRDNEQSRERFSSQLAAVRSDGHSSWFVVHTEHAGNGADSTALARRPKGGNEGVVSHDALVTQLTRLLEHNGDILLVTLAQSTEWNPLLERFPRRSLAVDSAEVSHGLTWASALADFGGHPVFVMTSDQLTQHHRQIVEELTGRNLAWTLIVLESDLDWIDVVNTGVSPGLIPFIPGATLVAPASLGELKREIQRVSLNERCLLMYLDVRRLWPQLKAQAESEESKTPAASLPEPPLPTVNGTELAPATPLKSAAARRTESRTDQQLIEAIEFSADTWNWIKQYETVGHRNQYLWKWCQYGIDLTTLPCVDPETRDHVCDTKLLSVIICVLLDDVADRRESRNWLEALLAAVHDQEGDESNLSEEECRHVAVTRALWNDYASRAAEYSRYDEYRDIWSFDLEQFFNTMRYAALVNDNPEMMNCAEHDLYTPHNMLMVSFGTLDLMCSRQFDPRELGTLREALWHAQTMGRIGNVISTWRREIPDRDFSAGIFARAVARGAINSEELQSLNPGVVQNLLEQGEFEESLLQKWYWHRSQCTAAAERIRSADLTAVLDAHDRFLMMHLASSGRI